MVLSDCFSMRYGTLTALGSSQLAVAGRFTTHLTTSMSNSRRFLRLVPLAAVLVITSLVSACSSDLTGPTAKRRSGYITTSAAVQALSTDLKSGTTTTGGTTGTGTTSTGIKKAAPADTSSLSSGYNVPAL